MAMKVRNAKLGTYPEMREESTRIPTFQKWPKQVPLATLDLVKAGFFYAGHGDCTVCYYCGGSIINWEENDNPWEEHAKHFKNCPLVQEYLKLRTIQEERSKKIGNKKIGNHQLCYICQKNKQSICFLPCEHVVVCENCEKDAKECPKCYADVNQKIKIRYA